MIPKNAKKLDHNHLAEGEVTGHFHAAEGATLYADPANDDTIIMDAKPGTVIRHQEHKPIAIPAGIYDCHKVVEFDPFSEEAKEVRD